MHDYLLGRRNMLAWLSRHFVLPDNNPIVRVDPQASGKRTLPIIPLVGGVKPDDADPPWPVLDPERDVPAAAIDARARGVLANFGRNLGVPASGMVARLLWWWLGGTARRQLPQAVTATNKRR